jgi:hypothetical protein
MKRREEGLESLIVRGGRQEHADAPNLLALLRARRERPRCRCTANKRDEITTPHGGLPQG